MKNQNHNKNELMEIKGSFRDPSGSLYTEDGVLYRRIAPIYQEHYDYAKTSGLYNTLMQEELLIPHQEIESSKIKIGDTYKIIKPDKIPFISYPYEWCFSQLKDAALLTLKIQRKTAGAKAIKNGCKYLRRKLLNKKNNVCKYYRIKYKDFV